MSTSRGSSSNDEDVDTSVEEPMPKIRRCSEFTCDSQEEQQPRTSHSSDIFTEYNEGNSLYTGHFCYVKNISLQ